MRIAAPEELSRPGVCAICRLTATQPGQLMIDTGRTIDLEISTPYNGTIYVCGGCRGQLVEVDNEFVRREDVEDQLKAAATARERYEAAHEGIASVLDNLQKGVN